MPELRRFAPNVPIVLVGTKLGILLDNIFVIRFAHWWVSFVVNSIYFYISIRLNHFILLSPDLREDRGYLADHMAYNIITTSQVYTPFPISIRL